MFSSQSRQLHLIMASGINCELALGEPYLPRKRHRVKTLVNYTWSSHFVRRYDIVGCRIGNHLLQNFRKLHNPNTIQCGARWVLLVVLSMTMYRSVHHVLELLDARWRPMNTVYSEIYVCVVVRISSRKWSKCKIPRGKLSTFASLLTMRHGVTSYLASQTHSMRDMCTLLGARLHFLIQTVMRGWYISIGLNF